MINLFFPFFFSPPFQKNSPGAHSKHYTTSRHQNPEPHIVAQALLPWHITYNFFFFFFPEFTSLEDDRWFPEHWKLAWGWKTHVTCFETQRYSGKAE